MKSALETQKANEYKVFKAKINEICTEYSQISSLVECLFQYMASDEISVTGTTYPHPPIVDSLGGVVILMKNLEKKFSECNKFLEQ